MDATTPSAAEAATPERPRISLVQRALRFLLLTGTVGALELQAISLEQWTLSHVGRRFGESLFYPFWLLLIPVATFALGRALYVPWRWSRATLTRANILIGLAAVLGVAHSYKWALGLMLSRPLVLPAITYDLICGSLFGPVAEEWIFRGALWSQLAPEEESSWAAAVAALVATSVAFGFWHLPSLAHSAITAHVFFGLLMGVLRWRFSSILPCILVHGIGNSLIAFVGK